MKKTAIQQHIEWLKDTLDICKENAPTLVNCINLCISDAESRLEMEKQQIIDARLKPLLLFKELRIKHGYFGGPDNGQVIDREINNSEQYYNETFKSE